MAFHIHRLGISASALTAATGFHRTTALDLRNGRLPLQTDDITALAAALNTADHDLVRPLEDGERMDWAFYRISARHSPAVWRNVATHLESAGYSRARAAVVLGLKRPELVRALSGNPTTILQRAPGQCLAEALSLGAAEIFLEGLTEPHKETSRGERFGA